MLEHIEILLTFRFKKKSLLSTTIVRRAQQQQPTSTLLEGAQSLWTPLPLPPRGTHGRRPSPPAAQPPLPLSTPPCRPRAEPPVAVRTCPRRESQDTTPSVRVETSEERQTLAMSPPFEACRWVSLKLEDLLLWFCGSFRRGVVLESGREF